MLQSKGFCFGWRTEITLKAELSNNWLNGLCFYKVCGATWSVKTAHLSCGC